ncbi:hypothetical protein ACFQT0_28505 [Hymenobacter humi]|uniref:Uncharacterized protein n=1 Tax=Hymenobacter humi TaxID=1411620 RepID=A0ABW2UDJ5_9BACT
MTELAGPPEAPTAVVVKALPGPTDALLHAWDAWADLGASPPGPPLVIYVAVASPQGEAAQRVDPSGPWRWPATRLATTTTSYTNNWPVSTMLTTCRSSTSCLLPRNRPLSRCSTTWAAGRNGPA